MPKLNKIELRSWTALEDLARWAARTPGAYTGIADRLTAVTGQRQFRQNVQEWLAMDPAARRQPRLGVGMFLVDLWSEIKRGKWTP